MMLALMSLIIVALKSLVLLQTPARGILHSRGLSLCVCTGAYVRSDTHTSTHVR
jgi:hypothetical protein